MRRILGKRTAPPSPRQGLVLAGTAAVGALGLLPGVAGGGDPVTLLGWLALIAPAAGFLVGAAGLRPLPFGSVPPTIWLFLVVFADAASDRDLAGPLWGALAVLGLFLGGMGLGALRPRLAVVGAGVLLLFGLLLAGLSVQGGLATGGESWGRTHPRLAALALDVSPVVLVLDCAGWDWTHSNPLVYELSGVEWFPRRPYRGPVAGSVSLVAGWALAEVLVRLVRRRGAAPEPAGTEGPDDLL